MSEACSILFEQFNRYPSMPNGLDSHRKNRALQDHSEIRLWCDGCSFILAARADQSDLGSMLQLS